MIENPPVCRVAIYHSFPGRAEAGYQKIATCSLNPETGFAMIELAHESQRESLAEISEGISLRPGEEPVTRDRGRIYLLGLIKLFSNSSYWRVVAEEC